MNIWGAQRLRVSAAITLCLITVSLGASERSGTSEVVLIDISKSFVPLTKADERAIQTVAVATAILAERDWPSPVSVLWSRIQSASLVARPLCGPFDFEQKLIKTGKELDPAEFGRRLEDCAKSAILAAQTPSEEAPYTDITGALTLASEQVRSAPGDRRYVVVVSDFVEDLPPGKLAVPLQLAGEHFLLLHRTGTQETVTVDHLARVESWAVKLQRAGAGSVVTLPLHSVTTTRIIRAFGQGARAGTNVVVLQNLPDTTKPEILDTIANVIGTAARDWPSPVTVTWADVRPRAEGMTQMPPAEFAPKLIKKGEAELSPDFPTVLKEFASGMRRFSPGAPNADLVGAIALYASAGRLEATDVFVIASNFPELNTSTWAVWRDLTGIRIVMLPGPNRKDESDQGAYVRRLEAWQKWFRDRHATVCKLPINGITESSLGGCLHGR